MTLRRRGRPGEDEQGAIIVIWAVALTAIMGLVALSVDLGNIAQTKRHTQSAVDAAALAGVVDLVSLAPYGAGLSGSAQSTAIANAEQSAVNDAETYLTSNYQLGSPDWNSCSLPSGLTTYSGADCFGFFPSPGVPYGMAVQIPSQLVKSSFGAADGFSGTNVSSTAYASVAAAQSSYIFPYALPATEAGLDCLKTGSGNTQKDPCAYLSPSSGQRGLVDSPRYFEYIGSDTSSSNNNTVLLTDLALGLDHPLNIHLPYSTVYCDLDQPPPPSLNGCDSTNYAPPHADGNAVVVSTGINKVLTGPLLTGSVNAPSPSSCVFGPRFNHPAGFAATGECANDETPPPTGFSLGSTPLLTKDNFGSVYSLNGRSVYAYLTAYGQIWAAGCNGNLPPKGAAEPIDAMSGSTVLWASWNSCFSSLMSGALQNPPVNAPRFPIFSTDASSSQTCAATPAPCNDIEASPRFGTVPIIDGSNACTGSSCADPIVSFEDVYLNLAYQQGSFSNKKNAIADEIQAWVFPQSWIQAPSSGSGLGGAYVANLCAWGVNC